MSLTQLCVACHSVDGALPVRSSKAFSPFQDRGRGVAQTQPRRRTLPPQPVLHPCDEPTLSPEPPSARATAISALNVDGRWNRRCMSARPQAVDPEAFADLSTGSLTPPVRFFVSTPKELSQAASPRCGDEVFDFDLEEDCLRATVATEAFSGEMELMEDDVSIFEAPDISLHVLEGEPAATCIRSVFHTVDFRKLMWQKEEVDSPASGHDVHAFEGTAKSPHVRDDHGRPPSSMFPRLGHFHSSGSDTTASARLDPEATDSALSTNSSNCDGQSGSGCKVADLEIHQKASSDERLEKDATSSNLLWSNNLSRVDSAVRLTGESVAVEGMRPEREHRERERRERRERLRLRLPGLRAPKADGPPMSPRAPFCAARGFFQTDGFVFSDLDLPGDVSGESEGGFSRSNSMNADCSLSRLNSVAFSIADEESSNYREAPDAATSSRGPRVENLAERLARLSSPNGEITSARSDGCAIGYKSARICESGHMRKHAYEATAKQAACRRHASPWPTVDISTSPLKSSFGDQIVHMWRETTAQIAEAMTTYTSSEPFQRNV